MESCITEDSHISQNAEIKDSTTTFPVDSKFTEEFEINQNYLKQPDTKDNKNGTSTKSNLDDTELLPVKDNDSSENLELHKAQCLEKEKKTGSRLILHVKKKPSFMVSAILDRTDQAAEYEAEIKQSRIHSTNRWSSKTTDAGQMSDDDQREDAPACLAMEENQADKSCDEEKGDSAFQVKFDYPNNKNYADNINENHNDIDNIDKLDKTGSSNFTNIIDSLRFQKDTSNICESGKFELKINEIKGRKEGLVAQINEMNQERKVRKRKQERPQSISFKLGEHENKIINEDNSSVERKSKRKQNITKRYYRYDTDLNAEQSNEIKQTPLCSKLCSSDFKKSAFARRNITVENEETSHSEDSNIPCTTNRYRRHFLKQLRNAEVSKAKSATEFKSEFRKQPDIEDSNKFEDYDSDDDYFFDGKRIKMSEIEENLDSNKCKVCNKEFNDIGTLMAHFICHSALEKEQASFMQFRQGLSPSTSVESSTYFCHLCDQKFTSISTLQEHVLEHSMSFTTKLQSQYECNLCMKSFANAGSLYLHKKAHTGDNPYTCNECNKHFRDKTRLTTHMRVHTGEKPFMCDICKKAFSQKGNLKLHQQKIHFGLKRSKHRCGKCDINFSDKNDLKEHLQKVHGIKYQGSHSSKSKVGNNSANSSGNKSKSQTASTEHISNTANKVAKSPISDTVQKSNVTDPEGGSLSGDKLSDKERDELINLECTDIAMTLDDGISENSNSSVSRNSSMIDDETAKPNLTDFRNMFDMGISDIMKSTLEPDSNKPAKFVCPLCDAQCQTAKSFNEHFLSHESVASATKMPLVGYSMIAQSGSEFPSGVKKVYRCEECSLDFVSFPEFQNHLKSHKDNNSKVMCNICQKQMSSSNLLDHMRIHTGEKPYGCVHCGKLFRRSHHLQTHLRTHTGDRPYVCVDCGKTFARGDHLQNHRRTHTGEKPYKCDICDKSYSQSHHLLRHKRTHTGEKPYNCQMCDKKFSRDHHLKKHMEVHRVVIYTGEKDGGVQKGASRQSGQNSNMKLKLEHPASPMTTRASDRIAHLMSAGWYGNMASELMADMVKRHLMANKGRETTVSKTTQDPADFIFDVVTESKIFNQSGKEDSVQEESVEKTRTEENESLVRSKLLENGEIGKETILQKEADAVTEDRKQAISFMDQMKAISIASALEDVVKQTLNENLDIVLAASRDKISYSNGNFSENSDKSVWPNSVDPDQTI